MCLKCNINIDQTQSDQFAERLVTILNHGAIGLMISLGYRTGLFDAMGRMDAATSRQIADEAGLNERYVREWLGAMVTGGIVRCNPEDNTYELPPEHAVWLTRENSPNNIAVTAQWLPLMAQVEDRMVEFFQKGGGLDYSEMNRFNEIMADESFQTVVTPLVDRLLPLVPDLKEKLEKGVNVLDVGCGSGKALIAMAKQFPKSTFTGYDFLAEAVQAAEAEASREGLTNIAFVQKDVAQFDEKEVYDVIFTFDAVHDQAKPDDVLKNIFTALKPDGTYFCQDIAGSSYVHKNQDLPLAPFMYAISVTGCMSVSLGQGGAGLGAMWGQELAVRMMKDAGFGSVDIKQLDHDVINYYYIVRK